MGNCKDCARVCEFCFEDEEEMWYWQLDIEIKILEDALKAIKRSKSLEEAKKAIEEMIRIRQGGS